MAQQIRKFMLEHQPLVNNSVRVMMPNGAKAIHVREQNGCPRLWALVDPEQPMVQRRFYLYGTGVDLPDLLPGRYLGTVHIGAALVIHVFDDVFSR